MINNRMLRRITGILLLLPTLLLAHPAFSKPYDAPAEMLATLQHTVIPARDPVDLARRFLGVTTLPTLPAAQAYKVGDVARFQIEDGDRNETITVSTQLAYATPH